MRIRRSARPSTSSARRTCSRPSSRRAERMAPLVYASSIAAYDAMDEADPAPDMKAHSRHDLRCLQARQRGLRAGLLGGARCREHRPAPAHRVRARTRSGRHIGADDARCSPPRPASPTTCHTAAARSCSTCPTSRARSSRRASHRPRARTCTTFRASPCTSREVIEAIASAVPASAGTITFEDRDAAISRGRRRSCAGTRDRPAGSAPRCRMACPTRSSASRTCSPRVASRRPTS